MTTIFLQLFFRWLMMLFRVLHIQFPCSTMKWASKHHCHTQNPNEWMTQIMSTISFVYAIRMLEAINFITCICAHAYEHSAIYIQHSTNRNNERKKIVCVDYWGVWQQIQRRSVLIKTLAWANGRKNEREQENNVPRICVYLCMYNNMCIWLYLTSLTFIALITSYINYTSFAIFHMDHADP